MMTFIVPDSAMIKACCILKFNGWKASTNIKKLNTQYPTGDKT